MRREEGVKYLLNKIQLLENERAQLRQQIKHRENFNRKLCSENRKRRLRNSELTRRENDRLLELANVRGHEDEYKKVISSLQRFLEQGEEKIEEYQDQIIILKSEVTKQKQDALQVQDENGKLKKKIETKDEQIERLMILQNQINKKRIKTETNRPVDYENEVFQLVCENQRLELRLRDSEKIIAELYQKVHVSEERTKSLEEELQTNHEIMNVLREEYELQLKEMSSTLTPNKPPQLKIETEQPRSIVTAQSPPEYSKPPSLLSTSKPRPNVSLDQFSTKLTNKKQEQFSSIENLFHSTGQLENLSSRMITVHHCQQINLYGNHTWYTRIRLSSEGEVNFGVTNCPFNSMQDVMNVRNYVYYNNCSGLIVINKEGKIIDEYASMNDTLTLCVSILQANRILKFYKNDRLLYEMPLPQSLCKGSTLYPYVRLFEYMRVDLQ